ncbi:MAG: hypothetical protein M3P43_13760 [Actinomycetota bacterium]|nr:hypothetical protein [Actinomycetota bacterium]
MGLAVGAVATSLELAALPLYRTSSGGWGPYLTSGPARFVVTEVIAIAIRPLVGLVGITLVLLGVHRVGAGVLLALGVDHALDQIGNLFYPGQQEWHTITLETLNVAIWAALILATLLLLRQHPEVDQHTFAGSRTKANTSPLGKGAPPVVVSIVALMVSGAYPLVPLYHFTVHDPTFHAEFHWEGIRHGVASLLMYESTVATGLLGLGLLVRGRYQLCAGVFLAIGLLFGFGAVYSSVFPGALGQRKMALIALSLVLSGMFLRAARLSSRAVQDVAFPARPD